MPEPSTSRSTPQRFGKYLLLERIGRGGMAEVYRSKTFGTAGFVKECAIKKILTSLLDDEQFVRMFVDEAKLTAFLTHPNIVQVLDLGELDGQLFIAMEYVPGKDLLDMLARSARRGIRIPVELTLYIVMELLKGLDFAHKALDATGEPMNIVHRDVSPSNILLSYDGQVKVGDFGIAKSQMQSSKTEVGTQKGKTGYMSPEQVTGEPIDHRSDLFAAAVILFEMLTMTRLFKAKSDLDVMIKIRDGDIEADLERAARVSPGLAQIIRRGLQVEPDDRFQTAAQFLDHLRDYVQDRRIKVSAFALSEYITDLFQDKIEAEREQRRHDPTEQMVKEEVGRTDKTLFRYRDAAGAIHGPMAAPMLVELLESRARTALEALSLDGGPWRPLSGLGEFATLRRPGDDAIPPDEDSSLGHRMSTGSDWEDLSLAGVNPNSRRRRRNRKTSESAVTDFNLDTRSGLRPTTEVGPTPAEAAPPAPSEAGDTPLFGVHRPATSGRPRGETSGVHAVVDDSSSGARWMAADPRSSTAAGLVTTAAESGVAPPVASATAPPVSIRNTATPVSTAEMPPPVMEGVAPGALDAFPPTTPRVTGDEVQELEHVPIATDHGGTPPALEGTVGDISVFRLAHRIARAGLIGRLRVTQDDVTKDLYFANGLLNAAESTAGTDSLIEFLREKDRIPLDAAEDAVRIHERTGVAMGNILLQLKVIAPHELFHFLQEQLAEKALGAMFWSKGEWAWYPNEQVVHDEFSATVDVTGLLARAVTERSKSGYFRRFYKNNRRTKLVLQREGDALSDLRISARAMRMISMLDTANTIAEIVRVFADRFKWSEAEVYRNVYTLTEYEVLGFVGQSEPPLPG